jgi:hypothetical protein
MQRSFRIPFQLSEQFKLTFPVAQNVSNRVALKTSFSYSRAGAETETGGNLTSSSSTRPSNELHREKAKTRN